MRVFTFWNSERVCRTRMISKGFFECKVKQPNPRFCEYSISMGNGYICNHLDRIDFIDRK